MKTSLVIAALSVTLASTSVLADAPAPGTPPAAAAISPDLQAAMTMLKLGIPQGNPQPNGSNASINLALEGGRTELVILAAQTTGPNGAKSRILRATAARMASMPATDLAARLLQDNSKVAGYWYVAQASDGQYYVTYAINVPVDATGEAIGVMASDVARTADKLELELTGKDEF